ncbi:MAG: putative 4-hydroxybenzoate polyprenyltransferase [Syntrophomonas sp.]|nr:putative 4-hydroxybenzoate polyprenyltransferase [Syntrophomonas sp.]
MTKLYKFFAMIDFGHTLFGLPFAYLGAFLAMRGVPSFSQLLWITVAMFGARSAALCLNRLIDRAIDRANPRTAGWVLPAGELPVGGVWILVVVFFVLLFWAAAHLNPLCVQLAPVAVLVLWGYSYTKRFTWWCHLLLGMAVGIGPVGGWIAITGQFDWRPLVLWLAVAFWIAGFDTMYACQDIEFDRAQGLYSIPARFGAEGALQFSAGFHLLAVICLVSNGWVMGLGSWYFAGVAFTALLLLYEHSIVSSTNLARVNFASFRINHYVGLIIFVMTLIDILG